MNSGTTTVGASVLACDCPLMEACARVRRDAHSLTRARTHARTHARTPTRTRVGARIHTSHPYSFTDMDAHALPHSNLQCPWCPGDAPPASAHCGHLKQHCGGRHGRATQPPAGACNPAQHVATTGQHVATQQAMWRLVATQCNAVRPSGPKLRFLIARDFGVHRLASAAQRSVCAL